MESKLIPSALNWISGVVIPEIKDQSEYDSLQLILKEAKLRAGNLEDERTAITKPINDSVKKINSLYKIPTGKLEELERKIKAVMLNWLQKQEAERAEKERLAREEAQKKQAELLRLEQEAAAKAQALRLKGMEKRADKQDEKATNLLKQAIETKPEAIPEIKKQGAAVITSYKAELMDKRLFVSHCLEKNLLHLLDVNLLAVNRTIPEDGNITLPGIQINKITGLRQRFN